MIFMISIAACLIFLAASQWLLPRQALTPEQAEILATIKLPCC